MISPGKIMYIDGFGTFLGIEKNRLYVQKKNEKKIYFHLFNIDAIVIYNNTSLSSNVIAACIDNNILIIFLDWAGRFIGRIDCEKNKNIFIRRSQIFCSNNTELVLPIIQYTIKSKIEAMHSIYPYKDLSNIKLLIDTTSDYESLLGIEGRATRKYFTHLRNELISLNIPFSTRTFHPPLDEANALLSLSYSLLSVEIMRAVQLFGMDPAFGFLHRDYYGRDSLVCDLIEPFRSTISDQYVLWATRKLKIEKKDFVLRGKSVFFSNDEKRRLFYKAFRSEYLQEEHYINILDFTRSIYNRITELTSDLGLVITKAA